MQNVTYVEFSHGVFYVTMKDGIINDGAETVIGTAFVVKSHKEVPNLYLCYFILKKLKLVVPEIRLLQHGEYEYASFQKAVERVTRLDDSIQLYVYSYP